MTARVAASAVALMLLLGGMAATADPPLTLGVVGFYNPRVMYQRYQPLVDYLSQHTGRTWELVISTEYQETVDVLCDGSLTLAYLGPFTYVRAHEACGASALVRLNTDGRSSFRSVVMVRDEAPHRQLADLQGKPIGFGAPLSTSSHLVPRLMFRDAGVPVGNDHAVFYGHHEAAARAVLLGEVEACGIRDVVADRFASRGLRVLARSEPLPNFPLAASRNLDPAVRRAVVDALISLPARDPEVRRVIGTWHPELRGGFAPSEDGDYDSVRAMARRLLGPDALRLAPEVVALGGAR
jgi:phosphonate transport system substrate-binding protein